MMASKLPVVTLYTFGSPRVGNAALAHEMESMIENYFRVEIDGDVVTQMPPPGFYVHAGTQVMVDSEGAGSIIVKPTIVEAQLVGTSGSSLANHGLDKYRSCLEACFEDSELEEYLESKISFHSKQTNVPKKSLPDWFLRR